MRKMVQKTCNHCGKKFMTRPTGGRVCCNSVCAMLRRAHAGRSNKNVEVKKEEPNVVKKYVRLEKGVKLVRVAPGAGYADW